MLAVLTVEVVLITVQAALVSATHFLMLDALSHAPEFTLLEWDGKVLSCSPH